MLAILTDGSWIYSNSMKTTIDVDRAAAESAARLLGTASLKDTVNAALREVVSFEMRRQLADRIRNRTLPVPAREDLARLRAPRVAVGFLAAKKRTR